MRFGFRIQEKAWGAYQWAAREGHLKILKSITGDRSAHFGLFRFFLKQQRFYNFNGDFKKWRLTQKIL